MRCLPRRVPWWPLHRTLPQSSRDERGCGVRPGLRSGPCWLLADQGRSLTAWNFRGDLCKAMGISARASLHCAVAKNRRSLQVPRMKLSGSISKSWRNGSPSGAGEGPPRTPPSGSAVGRHGCQPLCLPAFHPLIQHLLSSYCVLARLFSVLGIQQDKGLEAAR